MTIFKEISGFLLIRSKRNPWHKVIAPMTFNEADQAKKTSCASLPKNRQSGSTLANILLHPSLGRHPLTHHELQHVLTMHCNSTLNTRKMHRKIQISRSSKRRSGRRLFHHKLEVKEGPVRISSGWQLGSVQEGACMAQNQ